MYTNIMVLSKLCRACNNPLGAKAFNLFDNYYKGTPLHQMYFTVTNIKVKLELNPQLCLTCYKNTIVFYEWQQLCYSTNSYHQPTDNFIQISNDTSNTIILVDGYNSFAQDSPPIKPDPDEGKVSDEVRNSFGSTNLEHPQYLMALGSISNQDITFGNVIQEVYTIPKSSDNSVNTIVKCCKPSLKVRDENFLGNSVAKCVSRSTEKNAVTELDESSTSSNCSGSRALDNFLADIKDESEERGFYDMFIEAPIHCSKEERSSSNSDDIIFGQLGSSTDDCKVVSVAEVEVQKSADGKLKCNLCPKTFCKSPVLARHKVIKHKVKNVPNANAVDFNETAAMDTLKTANGEEVNVEFVDCDGVYQSQKIKVEEKPLHVRLKERLMEKLNKNQTPIEPVVGNDGHSSDDDVPLHLRLRDKLTTKLKKKPLKKKRTAKKRKRPATDDDTSEEEMLDNLQKETEGVSRATKVQILIVT